MVRACRLALDCVPVLTIGVAHWLYSLYIGGHRPNGNLSGEALDALTLGATVTALLGLLLSIGLAVLPGQGRGWFRALLVGIGILGNLATAVLVGLFRV